MLERYRLLIILSFCCDWTLLLESERVGFPSQCHLSWLDYCPYMCQKMNKWIFTALADKVVSHVICSRLAQSVQSRQSIEFPSVMVSYTPVSCSPTAQRSSHHPWPGSIISKSHYMALCSLFSFLKSPEWDICPALFEFTSHSATTS